MGKGGISGGGTDGFYDVGIEYARGSVDERISLLTGLIVTLETKISEKQSEYETLLITPGSSESYIHLQTTKSELNALKTWKLSAEKKLDVLNSAPSETSISVWCADLTEDLTGDVGIIEIPGESVSFNIQPGYDGNAAYNPDRDGQLMPTLLMTPAQAYYNLAMLPGWQKWKPTYRYGTITSITGDLADVTLDDTTSTQQGINVNQGGGLTDVEIDYMDCDGAAFEEGDVVIVKFVDQEFNSPKIIGFKDNPKPCGNLYLPIELRTGDDTLVVVIDLSKKGLLELMDPDLEDGVITQPFSISDYDYDYETVLSYNGLFAPPSISAVIRRTPIGGATIDTINDESGIGTFIFDDGISNWICCSEDGFEGDSGYPGTAPYPGSDRNCYTYNYEDKTWEDYTGINNKETSLFVYYEINLPDFESFRRQQIKNGYSFTYYQQGFRIEGDVDCVFSPIEWYPQQYDIDYNQEEVTTTQSYFFFSTNPTVAKANTIENNKHELINTFYMAPDPAEETTIEETWEVRAKDFDGNQRFSFSKYNDDGDIVSVECASRINGRTIQSTNEFVYLDQIVGYRNLTPGESIDDSADESSIYCDIYYRAGNHTDESPCCDLDDCDVISYGMLCDLFGMTPGDVESFLLNDGVIMPIYRYFSMGSIYKK